MNKYLIVIAHDTGILRLKVTAKSKQRAIVMVMKSENCPARSILSASKL